MNILVGVDGSEYSQRAVAWCAEHAAALGAKVIAVHALEVPVYAWRLDVYAPPVYTDADRTQILETLRDQWCRPLADAEVPYEAKVVDGLEEGRKPAAERRSPNEKDATAMPRRARDSGRVRAAIRTELEEVAEEAMPEDVDGLFDGDPLEGRTVLLPKPHGVAPTLTRFRSRRPINDRLHGCRRRQSARDVSRYLRSA